MEPCEHCGSRVPPRDGPGEGGRAITMPAIPAMRTFTDWRVGVPSLTARFVTLHEPAAHDLGPLVDLLSLGDATRFGLELPVTEVAVQQLLDRMRQDRTAG